MKTTNSNPENLLTSGERNAKDIEILAKSTEKINFFENYINSNQKDVHINCCKSMHLEFREKGDIVFEFGSRGYSFYIILSGSVGVFVPEKKKLIEKTIVYAGNSFGEVALLNSKKRLATIISISKRDFNYVLKAAEEKKALEQMNFLYNLPIFSFWNFVDIQKLYLNTHSLSLKRGNFVFKEGEEADYMYVLKEGTLKILKEIIFDYKTNEFFEAVNVLQKQKHFKIPLVELALLNEGTYFGEDDIILNKNRNYSVVCDSGCAKVQLISKSEFYSKVFKNEKTKEILIDQAKKKTEWINFHINQVKELRNKKKKLLNQVNFNLKKKVYGTKKNTK